MSRRAAGPRILGQRYEAEADLSRLEDHPRNPRLGDGAAVAGSIAANGFYGAIIAQESTRRILAGHTRRRELAAAGATRGPVLWVDVDDATAERILVADNRTGELAAWDEEALLGLLRDMSAGEAALAGTGFSEDDLANLAARLRPGLPEESGEVAPDRRPGWGDEWYTPRWIFDAAGLTFDLDVCAPADPACRTVPARRFLTAADEALSQPWDGLVWMNPPFSSPAAWVDRFARHPAGLALAPAAKSAWRGTLMAAADVVALLSVDDFGHPDGSTEQYPFALILAGRGPGTVEAVARVAAVGNHSGGAWHVRGQAAETA